MLSYALDRCGYLKIQAQDLNQYCICIFLEQRPFNEKEQFRTDPIPNCPEISFFNQIYRMDVVVTFYVILTNTLCKKHFDNFVNFLKQKSVI